MNAERPQAKKRKRTPKRSATELAIEKRRESACQLRLAGWSIRDISGHLHCSIGTVHSDLSAVLERTSDTADAAIRRERAISLARLDVATKGIWPSVETGDLEAIDRLVRIEARRARTVGFDAPARQEMSGPGGAPITLDARAALIDRLTGLVTGEDAGGSAYETTSEPEPGGD